MTDIKVDQMADSIAFLMICKSETDRFYNSMGISEY